MRDSRGPHHFHTKVVGVTFRNSDGTDRQELIARCRVSEPVQLIADPDNPVDADAVAVCRANGEQLGHLRAELAREIVNKSAMGWRYAVCISDLTGGNGKNRGVNLLLLVAPPGVSDDEAQRYADAHGIGRPSPTVAPTVASDSAGPAKLALVLVCIIAAVVLIGWLIL
jgi:hypothetical protein